MEMSAHRVLAELKTISKRIKKEIDGGTFIGVRKLSATAINGQTVAEAEASMKSAYQKVADLINRRMTLKRALVLSNAGITPGTELRKVRIGKESMTVAEAIERQNGIAFEKQFLDALRAQHINAVTVVNKKNEDAQSRLDIHLNTIFGSDRKDVTPESLKTHTEAFNSMNQYTLVDPLKLQTLIDDLDEKINTFETEVDAVLSEENARTMIVIDAD